MIFAAIYRGDGTLSNFFGAPTENDIKAQVADGGKYYIVPAEVAQFLPINMEPLRAMLRGKLREMRDDAQAAGCLTPFGTVDSDQASQLKILGAVVTAQISPPEWSIDWTMADNSVVSMSAAGVTAMGVAVSSHVNNCHQYARALSAELDSANDIPDAYAVLENAEWPS